MQPASLSLLASFPDLIPGISWQSTAAATCSRGNAWGLLFLKLFQTQGCTQTAYLLMSLQHCPRIILAIFRQVTNTGRKTGNEQGMLTSTLIRKLIIYSQFLEQSFVITLYCRMWPLTILKALIHSLISNSKFGLSIIWHKVLLLGIWQRNQLMALNECWEQPQWSDLLLTWLLETKRYIWHCQNLHTCRTKRPLHCLIPRNLNVRSISLQGFNVSTVYYSVSTRQTVGQVWASYLYNLWTEASDPLSCWSIAIIIMR